MGIWNFFEQRRTARKAELISSEVAQRSVAPVLGRVKRRAATMRNAEARGYVRARALEIVHRELAALQKGHSKLESAQQIAIISQAVDHVVTRVLTELRATSTTGQPATRQVAA